MSSRLVRLAPSPLVRALANLAGCAGESLDGIGGKADPIAACADRGEEASR
jgi:hypothetical protein